ncbi:COX15/CtaA family protein [Phytoactinopolyspora mesophila]|uniref:COX15/CtaA family protein n=1 Tax=Phytoactinopolyspora mesophila TaxID=2650750 RepID=UPI0013916EE8
MTTTQRRPAAPPARLRGVQRLPLASEATLRKLAYASLATQAGIIVTGGAVRLTDSGLGCPEWPRCTAQSWTSTPEMGIHGAVEFGNRLLTFVLGFVALAMLLAVIRTFTSDRPRRDLLYPSIFLFGVIPAQAFIGGITVWTNLNPWVVMFHFLVSAVLVGVATVLVRRAQRPALAVPRRIGVPWLERLGVVTLVATAITIYLGTVVTGSGPHAGDPDAPRTGFDLGLVAGFHAHAAAVMLGLTIGLYFAARVAGSPGRTARTAAFLLGALLAQGIVGAVQYRLELPELLVAIHLAGAAVMVFAAVDAWYATRWHPVRVTGGARSEAVRAA